MGIECLGRTGAWQLDFYPLGPASLCPFTSQSYEQSSELLGSPRNLFEGKTTIGHHWCTITWCWYKSSTHTHIHTIFIAMCLGLNLWEGAWHQKTTFWSAIIDRCARKARQTPRQRNVKLSSLNTPSGISWRKEWGNPTTLYIENELQTSATYLKVWRRLQQLIQKFWQKHWACWWDLHLAN